MSLIFAALNKGGGSGGGAQKPEDKEHKKKSEAAEHPTNFFDSTTAALVESTASEGQPESGKVPDNFFDSVTASVMGKESAAQLKQLDEIQNPKNFFDYFAGSVMGLQPSPQTSGSVLLTGTEIPPVPSEPTVPFGPPPAEQKKLESQTVKGEEERKVSSEAVIEGKKAEGEKRQEVLEAKKQFELVRLIEGKKAEAREELDANLKFHEAALRYAEHNNGLDARQIALELLKHAREEKGKAEGDGKESPPPKPKKPPKLLFAPAGELEGAINDLKAIVHQFATLPTFDDETRKVFQNLEKSLNETDKKTKGVSKEMNEILEQTLPPEELKLLKQILPPDEADDDEDGEKDKDKDKADEKKKQAATSVINKSDDYDKALYLVSSKCNNITGIMPAQLPLQSYSWSYARAS